MLDTSEEIDALRAIIKRVQKSPQWWARLSFPNGAHGKPSFWSERDREVLARAGITGRHDPEEGSHESV